MRFYEHHKRSLAKAISFRLLVLTIDFSVIILITKRYDLALGVVLISSLFHTILYFIHERIWNNIYWGRNRKV